MKYCNPFEGKKLPGFLVAFLPFFVIALSSSIAFNQEVEYRPGDILIQVQKDYTIEGVARAHVSFENQPTGIEVAERLSKHSGIYRLTFDFGKIHQGRFLAEIRSNPGVKYAQLNHRIRNRDVDIPPNDPRFSEQWHLNNTGQSDGTPGADISALEAWEITTGGLSALGDTIVIAVVDDGVNLEHPDLQGMFWVNRHEIANTGLDDDENGYIDDVYGWNTFLNNATVSSNFLGSHGTPVTGMIGAVTNNDEGIAGLNWNIKIMTVVGGNGFESNAIAAYEYILTQRKIYNETNGERGAFVVATNSSWGVDGGNPEDAPLWCNFYDTLGVHGILSVAATTNLNADVDVVKDLPTACSSPFLISVTSTTRSDQRNSAGFGEKTIELGAPGSSVLTTRNDGSYRFSSGTSFASPLVAGVIGLMYSAPCEGLIRVGRTIPEASARMVRNYLLQGVDVLPNLEGFTISGGRVNAANAIEILLAACSDCPSPLEINIDEVDDFSLEVSWEEVLGTERVDLRVRRDSGDWQVNEDVFSPFELDLDLCTHYEIELRAICQDSEGSWTNITDFTTIGCCEAPSEFNVEFDGPSTAILSWNEILPAFEYNIRFRAFGDEFWKVTDLWEPNFIVFEDLEPCHLYEYQVQARCDTGFTAFSEIMILETPECTDCDSLPFCEPTEINADFEWIDTFLVAGEMMPVAGAEVGYAAMTDGIVRVINMGEELRFSLVPGFAGNSFPQYFRIWLDFNRDGEFSEEELIFDPGRTTTDAIDSTIVVPINEGIEPGHVRMRVSMQFMEDADSIPPINACDTIEFGQVLDYCVFLYQPTEVCPEIEEARAEVVSPEGILVQWDSLENALAYNIRYRELNSFMWEEEATPDTFYQVSGLEPCTSYEIQVRRICTFDTSKYTISFILMTECPNSVIDPEFAEILSVKAFPNPFNQTLYLRAEIADMHSGDYALRIFDINGRLISNRTHYLPGGVETQISIDQLSNSPPGIYFIEITDGIRRKVLKVIKQ